MIRQPARSTLFPCGTLFRFFFNDTATTEIYTLSLHDALPISGFQIDVHARFVDQAIHPPNDRSEEHTSELQSLRHLVCRLLLEKKKKIFGYTFALRRPRRRTHVPCDLLCA